MKCINEFCGSNDVVFIRNITKDGQVYKIYYCRHHGGRFAVLVNHVDKNEK